MKTKVEGGSSLPLIVVLGLALPTVIALYFYLSYAGRAWFYQDDFGFISQYAASAQWGQLFDFTNFGRFLSRNGYWHWGIKYFSHNAQYFFIFNFFVISGSSYLLYKIFEKYGRFEAFVAGLFYFILPATIESYTWLSNSQHILGHFFVILFVYIFINDDANNDPVNELFRTLQLVTILVLGFESNIFMSMVLSLPAWMLLTDKEYRKLKSNYLILVAGILLFLVFFVKLSGNQQGAYSTAYNFETVRDNLDYYFKSGSLAVIWFLLIATGSAYSLVRRKYFSAWLFLASAAFFLPFAFFIHQRYSQYGDLAYLFLLLGIWMVLLDSKIGQRPDLIRYSGLAMIGLLFLNSLEPPIRYFSEGPLGAEQKKQVQFLKVYDSDHPDVKNYCFRSPKQVINTTGVKEWDIPGEWWAVGFGSAYSLFVSSEKTYELVQDAKHCDVVFIFNNGRLEVADH